ncbi:MAG: histidine kinase, partial [Bacteroidota bacterium]|nr:histidine kinase [Bacteroidota bacterium]
MAKNLLLSLLLLFPLLADSQDSGGSSVIHDRPRCPVLDTGFFHEINLVFQEEVEKRGSLDLETLQFYAGIGKQIATEASYPQGAIQMNLGLGSGFLHKNKVDSAEHYYALAICQSDAIRDTLLLAKAFLGLGWTRVYDDSDYTGAMYNVLKANSLVHAIRDSSYMMFLASRLVRLYELTNDLYNGYLACFELSNLSAAQKDTTLLVDSYYMIASLYDDMDLHDWQMQVVHKCLALKPYVKDTLSLYRIHLTASAGYLNKKDFTKAMDYARINQPFAKALYLNTSGMENLALVYHKMNQLDSARYYFEASMNQSVIEEAYVDTYLYLRLGQIEFKSGQNEKAIRYLKMAESRIKKPSLNTQMEIYQALYEYYSAKQNHMAALKYLENQTLIADSIATYRVSTTVISAKSQKLADQISMLEKENELKETKAAQQKQKQRMMLGSAGVVSIFAVLGFIRFRRNKIIKNKQALLKERLRISRELHDEVGSTLSGIAMYSHVAREQVKNSDNIHAEQSLSIMQ